MSLFLPFLLSVGCLSPSTHASLPIKRKCVPQCNCRLSCFSPKEVVLSARERKPYQDQKFVYVSFSSDPLCCESTKLSSGLYFCFVVSYDWVVNGRGLGVHFTCPLVLLDSSMRKLWEKQSEIFFSFFHVIFGEGGGRGLRLLLVLVEMWTAMFCCWRLPICPQPVSKVIFVPPGG